MAISRPSDLRGVRIIVNKKFGMGTLTSCSRAIVNSYCDLYCFATTFFLISSNPPIISTLPLPDAATYSEGGDFKKARLLWKLMRGIMLSAKCQKPVSIAESDCNISLIHERSIPLNV